MASFGDVLALMTPQEDVAKSIATKLKGTEMRKKLLRPWLTGSEVEIPLAELKQISEKWDEQTWNEYLKWFEVSRKDKLVSHTLYNIQGESIEKNIFEEFGYQSCPKLQNFCEQLLAVLPAHQAQILKLYFYDGRTHKEIAFMFGRSDRTISYNKNKALKALKWVHDGESLAARRIMRGAVDFISEEINSEWAEKLSHPVCNQQSYSLSEANNELLNHKCAELREIFQELTDRSRQIIYLKFWCNLSVSEIARKCSVGLNNVEQILDATVFKIKSRLIQNINEDKQIA